MSISIKLREFLEQQKVAFEPHVHPTAFTAQEIAATMHLPGREMAKTVVVYADGALVLAVIPADRKLNLEHLKFITRAENIRLATENEFKDAFPSCELGAMPPFGVLFGLATYCDTLLEQNDNIEFNAGSHNDTIQMDFNDFKRLAKPIMADLVEHPRERAA